MPRFFTDPLFLALVGFIVLLLAVNIVQRVRRGSAWKEVAAATGLQFATHHTGTYNDQTLSGSYRGRMLTLAESRARPYLQRQRRSNRGPDTDTTLRLKINNPKGVTLRLNREISIGSTPEIVTGDAAIDGHFRMESQPGEFAKVALARVNLQQKLPQLKMGGTVFAQGPELLYTHDGILSDRQYLQFLFDFLSDVADAIEAYR